MVINLRNNLAVQWVYCGVEILWEEEKKNVDNSKHSSSVSWMQGAPISFHGM